MRPSHQFLDYLQVLFNFSKRRFVLGCLLTVASTLLSGIGLLLLIPLLHYAGWLHTASDQSSNLHTLLHYLPEVKNHLPLLIVLLIFIVLISCIAALQYWQAQVMAYLRQDYLFSLRKQFNELLVSTKWAFMLESKLKQIEYFLGTGLNQVNMLTYYCIQMISNLIIIILYLIFSFIIAFKLTLLTLCVTCILFALLKKHKAHLLGKASFESQSRLQEELGTFLEGIKLAKSYNQNAAYLQRFDALNHQLQQSQKNFSQNSYFVRFLFVVASACIFALIFFTAVHFFNTSILALLALLIIFARLLPQFSILQQAYLQAIYVLPIYTEIEELRVSLQKNQETLAPIQSCVWELKNGLHLEQLCYRYHPQQTWVLNQLTCIIPAKKTTAIIGASGAGKSTLADLLLGLLTPSSGSIYIDDHPLNADKYATWRQMISYIPQDPYFFNDTIRNNLLWAMPTASETELWQCLKLAAADQFVTHLPQQLDTITGDRALKLSGGERQRLAFARALLRKPDVLLLDEATSALDHFNESFIYQTLKKLHGHITLIIIAHRYDTIRLADHVLVLEQGHLVESGNPDDLLKDFGSTFFKLFSKDFR